MRGEFCFHGVGQGLFYSGFIYGKDKQFSIVYDCGSESRTSYIEREVDNFLRALVDKHSIDLLVVSHFDRDHINGLEKLLKHTHAKYVVIPYYTPAERLCLINDLSLLDNGRDEFYINFLSNPYAYFRNKDIKIIPLGGEDNSEQEGVFYNLEDINYYNNNTGNEQNISPIGNKIRIVENLINWEILFYNVKPDISRLKVYKDYVDTMLKSYTLEEILKDKTLRDKISKNKKKLMPISESNYNSVVLYHAPISENYLLGSCCCTANCYGIGRRHCHAHCCLCCEESYIEAQKTGTLLTGDLDCLDKEMPNIYKFITEKRFDNIGVFLVPHHGSDVPYEGYDFPNCVISYGTINRHGHPSGNTLKKIAKCNTNLILVNEKRSYCYIV